MGYTENLCMNCFEPLTAGCICRNCGFDNDSVTDTLFFFHAEPFLQSAI